jgi:glucose-1-phosphate thymidylyltransferase
MKGIILAGGMGSRLYPCSTYLNKQLLPVYDKPMIYYPLTTLLENGINEICIITSENYIAEFRQLLGKGTRFGAKITYKIQSKPRGISEAFIIARNFIRNSNVALILGDNIFYGCKVFTRAIKQFEKGGTIFGYKVSDPTRYGVVELDSRNRVISLEEKPKEPKSDLAIPGFYLFDKQVSDISKALKPSARGELEITDVISAYKDKEELKVVKINRGCAWLDAGTSTALHDSAAFIQAIEHRQGIKVGCPEEAALMNNLISKDDFSQIVSNTPDSEYKNYLLDLLAKKR